MMRIAAGAMSDGRSATDVEKELAARRAAEMVTDGQSIGLGTGSTSLIAIKEIARRITQEGLNIRGVATSDASYALGMRLGIPMESLNDFCRVDVTIDGADEIDPQFNMIKGGGGALVREKLVAIASDREVIIIDSSKRVSRLGEKRALPVEVVKFGWHCAAKRLEQLGCRVTLRDSAGRPFESDNGNYILDCDFGGINDAPALEKAIKVVPGVVDSGLFIGLAATLIVGTDDRVAIIECKH